MDIRETVHELIKKNKVFAALELLTEYLEKRDYGLYKEAIELSGKFEELETGKRNELITKEEALYESNNIFNALQLLAEKAFGKSKPGAGKEGMKPMINVDNAGVVGDEVNLSGEYVAGGNITINYFGKEEKEETKEVSLSDVELEGLIFTEEILIEKLNDFRKAFAVMADGAKKFELKKSIQQAENELADVRKKMGK